MIDILSTLAHLQREKWDNNIVPDHVELTELLNEVVKEARKELNLLYKEGRIGTTRTVNGTGVYVKGKGRLV